MQRLSVACAGLLVAACSGDGDRPAPDAQPPFSAEPFWFPVDLTGARALGQVPSRVSAADVVEPGPVSFVDATDAAGLGEQVGGGNQHGVGVALVDVTGDDLPDLVVANGRSNVTGQQFASAFWRNAGDGTFEDATAASGIGDITAGRDLYSVAAADYDNDGDVDLYFGAQPTDILARNDGSGVFSDVTEAAGAGGPPSNPDLVSDGRSKVVAFGDFDGDGHIDIASASSTLPAPDAYLLRNRGDGTFADVTAATGMRAAGRGNPCAIMWTDYDNDGDADLWIWNDRGGKVLLRNESGVAFTDVTADAQDVDINNPMGIDGADMDHDGDLDYYVSNIGNNPLLESNGAGAFTDITREAGTGGEYGWGLAFEDFDADSWADLFVAQEDDRTYLVFTNQRGAPARFSRGDVAHPVVQNSSAAHNVAAAFGDYDRDGRTDVVTVNTDGTRITLHRNATDLGTAGWLEVRVPAVPSTGERGGIGVRIGVKTGDLIQFRDITGGSSRASQNDHSVRFGLGHYTGAEWVFALWPDGRSSALVNVAANQSVDMP